MPPRKWARIQGHRGYVNLAVGVQPGLARIEHGLDRGLDTMLIVAAAHRSAREGRTIRIDRSAGCTPDALAAV